MAYKLDPRQSFSWFGLHLFSDKLLPSYINNQSNQNEQLTTQGFRGCGLDAEKRPSDCMIQLLLQLIDHDCMCSYTVYIVRAK